jgi:hypothetical protein
MWEVHYSQESATYLEDNGQLIVDLFFAMESLVDSDGVPTNGDFQDVQGLVYWSVEEHLVVYRRIDSTKIIRVILSKPKNS